jgi:hypothetical protein
MQIAQTGQPNIFKYQGTSQTRLTRQSYAASTAASQIATPEGLASHSLDSHAEQKLADFSRVQSAFLAAMKTGESIRKHFDPIV